MTNLFPITISANDDPFPLSPGTLWFWFWVATLKGIFFALAAYVQHNDPDPYLWIPAYGIPSLLSFHLSYRLSLSLTNFYWSRRHFLGGYGINKNHSSSMLHLPKNSPGIERIIEFQIIYSFALGLYTLTTFSTNGNQAMRDEEAKELMGLCIITFWLGLIRGNNFTGFGKWVGAGLGGFISIAPLLSWIFVEEMERC